MDVTLALLADAANVSQSGKLNILGVFDQLFVREIPWINPMCYLVLKFEASPAEQNSTKDIEMKFLDQDGKQLGSINGKVGIGEAQSGRRIKLQTIVALPNLGGEGTGSHVFAVLISGETKKEILLEVTLLQGEPS